MAGVSQKIEIDGLKETLRAFNRYGKDANAELRDASQRIADATAAQARSRASGYGGVRALAGQSVKARRDRTPKIVGGGRGKAGGIFFGAEFGGQGRPATMQFPPHRGTDGYFLWPTIRAREAADLAEWMRAVDKVSDRWARGG